MSDEKKFVHNAEKTKLFQDELQALLKKYKDDGVEIQIVPKQSLFIEIGAFTKEESLIIKP